LERDIKGFAQELQREGVTQQTIDALLADYDVIAFEKSTQRAAEKFTPKGLDEIIGGIKL
jgi:SOS response regulatory protein OraA/RecX